MSNEPRGKSQHDEEDQDEVTLARSILDDIIEETENEQPSDSAPRKESDGCLALEK